MTDEIPPRANGRIKAFDSLRGIAAIGVVFWHYGAHFHAQPFKALLSPFYSAGYLLVDFFFVLSGYVIAQAYWKESRQHRLFANVWSRISRLYPLHLLTLFTVLIAQWVMESYDRTSPLFSNNGPYNFVLNVLMLNGTGLQQGFSFNEPAWSISTEFVVNIGFMVFISSPIWARAVYIWATIFLCGLLFFLSQAFLRNDLVFGYLDPQLVRCALGFSMGVVLRIALNWKWIGKRVRPAFFDISAAATVALTVLFLATQGPHAPVKSYFVIMTLSAALLVTVLKSHLIKRALEVRPLVFLGEISYSVYLVHFPLQILFLLLEVAIGTRINFSNPMIAMLYLGILIYLSHFTYRKIELPSQAFLNSRVRSKVAPLTALS